MSGGKEITLVIRHSNGSTSLKVKTNHTIKELKNLYASKTSICSDKIDFIRYGRLLSKDNYTLNDYGINKNSVIFVIMKLLKLQGGS